MEDSLVSLLEDIILLRHHRVYGTIIVFVIIIVYGFWGSL